jgi:hypothetical protein
MGQPEAILISNRRNNQEKNPFSPLQCIYFLDLLAEGAKRIKLM